MQVACDRCGATYEFESSAIPADGYDAQCTGCGHVFFVAPERLEPTVSVTCGNCQTVYRFAASAIPEGGYDAQCTQCQAVFFVPSPAAGEPGGRPRDGEPGLDAELVPAGEPPADTMPPVAGGAAPSGDPLGQARAAGLDASDTALPDGEEAALEEEAEVEAASWREPESGSSHDHPAAPGESAGGATPGGDVPAPVANPTAAAPVEDPAAPAVDRARARHRPALLAAGAAAALAVAAIAAYVAAPSLRESGLARRLGLGRSLPLDAAQALAHARELLLADSPAALDEALAEADRVRLAVPRDATAVATAALVHAVRAIDAGDEARRLRERAERAVEAARAAPAVTPEEQVLGDELRRTATEAATSPLAALERADRELAACARLSAVGRELDPRSWRVALAAAYCEAADPITADQAEALLQRSLELRGGQDATLDLRRPPDGWTPMLRGLLWARSPGDRARVRDALSAALAKEPRLQHARLALARELLRGGDRAGARRLVEELVAAVPDHGPALALLASLEPPPAAIAPAARAPSEQQPAARAKKRRGKRRR